MCVCVCVFAFFLIFSCHFLFASVAFLRALSRSLWLTNLHSLKTTNDDLRSVKLVFIKNAWI